MASMRGTLRRVRVNAQALKGSLAELDATNEQFAKRMPSETTLWTENATQIEDDLASVRAALDATAQGPGIEDEVEAVDNAWDRAKQLWSAFAKGPATDQTARKGALDAVAKLLDEMVRRIGFLTIPQRVQEYVAMERTGGAFDFHKAFQDELPSREDRVAVLEYLAESPGRLYGIVDVERGFIYAVSPDAARRSRSYWVAAGILVLGAVIAWFFSPIAAALGLGAPFTGRSDLFAAYVLVAIGVVVHILVDIRKESKKGDRGRWTAVDDLLLWGHVRELEMYATAFSVWAGTIALAFVFRPIEPFTAFLAGYSLDSFLDIALARFDTVVAKGTEEMTKRLAAPAGEAA